jgi:SAM-dependent methyltransferase
MDQPIIWLSPKELDAIFSSAFWNDIEVEKLKEWWIDERNPTRSTNYLVTSGLLNDYNLAERLIVTGGDRDIGDRLDVLDLAAGVGWTSALLSKLPCVKHVHAVEISAHRLGELFEKWSVLLKSESYKIKRYLGSFYDLKFPNECMDVVFMSQAFHHAHSPLRLLLECDRVLKKGGRIILVGEHHITTWMFIRRILKHFVQRRKFSTNFYQLFPSDKEVGDHYYRISDYYFLFGSLGYSLQYDSAPSSDNLVFYAKKE